MNEEGLRKRVIKLEQVVRLIIKACKHNDPQLRQLALLDAEDEMMS